MAHAIPSDIVSFGSYAPAERPGGILARLASAFAAYRVFLATCDELDSLSDRELADLGISRLSIRDVAAGAAYGG